MCPKFTVYIHITSATIIQTETDHTKNVTVKHTLRDPQEYIKYIMLNPPCDTSSME
jgi:hypothetical protein